MTLTTDTAAERRSLGAALVRRGAQVLSALAAWLVCYFVAAGRVDIPRAWIYLMAGLALLVVNGVVAGRRNPDVIKARAYGGAGTKRFDRIFAVCYILAMLAVPVVAGLDAVRFGWAPLSLFWLWPGLALFALSDVPILWAMVENRHLEQTVRIQADRGHQVVSTGPYALVRHPMYAGTIVQHLAMPLIIGSLWAFVPVAALCVTIVVRTALEDRTLRRELAGFAEYAQRTRSRLVPGVW